MGLCHPSLMHGEVSAERLFRLLSTVDDGPARDFVAAMRGEVETMPAAVALDINWGSMRPSLHHIYSVRREHLGERGVDVRGLDAFLSAIESSPEGTEIGFIVVKSNDANLVAICDHDLRSLVGWVLVPRDLPSLDEFRSAGPREPSH